MSSSILPDDLLYLILLLLPAGTLVKFRSVCKSWSRIISDSSFAQAHLNRTIQSKDKDNHLNLITLNTGKFFTTTKLWIQRSSDSEQVLDTRLLPFPASAKFSFVSSFNGILCFVEGKFELGFSIYLCNPVIRRGKCIPFPLEILGRSGFNYGFENIVFGYDSVTKDYKVLLFRIVNYCNGLVYKVHVYSLNTDSWRLINLVKPWTLHHADKVIFRGSVHWVAGFVNTHNNSLLIASFDLKDEVFGEIRFSKSMATEKIKTIRLSVFDGCLCVFVQCPNTQEEYQMWVMKEYGVVESWTKLCIIMTVGNPFAEFLLQSSSLTYDPANKMIHDYVESLVSW